MKKRFMFLVLCFLFCSAHAKDKKPEAIQVQAGTVVASLGIALDASYDRKLDGLVPKYKILTVAITNNSIDMIQLDKENDKWWAVDSKGSKHEAIIDLRVEAPKSYAELPEKLKHLIEYPLMVQVGETKPIDLIFRDSVDLGSFRSVRFESVNFGRIFDIIARE